MWRAFAVVSAVWFFFFFFFFFTSFFLLLSSLFFNNGIDVLFSSPSWWLFCFALVFQMVVNDGMYASHTKTMLPMKKSAKIQQAIRPYEDLLTIVKRCEPKWYVHQVWPCTNTILQDTVKKGRRQGREKKRRQTETEMGRQHQVMDRPGVHQVQEGSGEQRKMKETGWEVICGAPTTPAVTG